MSKKIKETTTQPSIANEQVSVWDEAQQKAITKPVKDVFAIKQKFTTPVTSIKRMPELIVQITSGIFKIQAGNFGPANEPSMAPAVSVVDVLNGTEYVLILNAVMNSALLRAEGQCSCVPDKQGDRVLHHGSCTRRPLEGRYFAFRGHEYVAGDKYRQVDVAELQRVG